MSRKRKYMERREAYDQGVRDGSLETWRAVDAYVTPMSDALDEVNGIINYIHGLLALGHGETLKAFLSDAAPEMMACITRLDFALARMKQALGISDDESVVTGIENARALYQAIKTFCAAKTANADELLALAGQHPMKLKHLRLNRERRPGRKPGQTAATRAATEVLGTSRQSLDIPDDRDLQPGEIDKIRQRAVQALEARRGGLTKAERDALALIDSAPRQYLSTLIKRGKASSEIIFDDDQGRDSL